MLRWLTRNGFNAVDAEDAAQGFMEFLLARNRLDHFVRGKTKFRSFLLECLQRYLRDQWHKDTAAKRGGGQVPLSLDELEIGVASELDKELDRDMALAVHGRVLRKLEEKFSHTGPGKPSRFGTLRRFILGADPSVSYAEVAEALHLTVGAVKKAVFDLREAYCDLFRIEVTHLVAREGIEEEMRYLITLLADTEATA